MLIYMAGGYSGNIRPFWDSFAKSIQDEQLFLAGGNGKEKIIRNHFDKAMELFLAGNYGSKDNAQAADPKGKILGISKIGRVVDYCGARLQVQERLVHDVVSMLEDALGSEYPPLGIALVMKGEHLCKTMRGAKKQGIMTSSFLTGIFKESSEVRAEFMQFVK